MELVPATMHDTPPGCARHRNPMILLSTLMIAMSPFEKPNQISFPSRVPCSTFIGTLNPFENFM
jgi:hypothetical protein